MGVTNPNFFVDAISTAGDYLYVRTGNGIDRWSFPGFVQDVDWHIHAGGATVQSIAVDNGGVIYHKATASGHLFKINDDLTGETDIGAIGASDIRYSPHEDCLYGINGNSLVKITLAGTETTVFTGSTFLLRPTIQIGGIIWVVEGFGTLHRFDPDAAYAHTSTSISGFFYTAPNCTHASVRANSNVYSAGITVVATTCSPDVNGLFAAWTSDYSLILGSDGNSSANKVYQLQCGGIRPPLRIRQRNDDLETGGPRIPARTSSIQRSIRIYGPNAYA